MTLCLLIRYRLPVINLLVPLFSSETETAAWPQIQSFLETVTLVSALMLSLTITAGTAVNFEELTVSFETHPVPRSNQLNVHPLAW